MHNETVITLLKSLRFNGMLSQLDEIMEVAEIKKLTPTQWLQQLLETEIAYRETRSLRYRLELARLPQVKSFENFYCDELPIKQEQLSQLVECQSLRAMDSVVVASSPR